MANLNAIWDKYKDEYNPGIREMFSFDGVTYGFPLTVSYWPVFYNAKVFNKLGLTPPQTWKEYQIVCSKLKSHKIIPMLGTVEGGWTTFIHFEQFVIGEGPKLYQDLMAGRVKYTDQRVRRAMMVWRDMIQRGYFSPPTVDMFKDAPKMFKDGSLAMIQAGTWYTGTLLETKISQEDIGYFILPSQNPKAGKNLVIESIPILLSEKSPHKKEAMKIAEWWMSAKGSGFSAGLLNAYPGNIKANRTHLSSAKKGLLTAISSQNVGLINRFWEATPVPIAEAVVAILPEFITNPKSLDSVLVKMEDAAAKHWNQQKRNIAH